MINSFPCSSHNLVLTVDALFSWGLNNEGQLGLGNNNHRYNTPRKLEAEELIYNLNDAILIGCGYSHTIISTNEGAYSFGSNYYGQLGLGHNRDQNKPSLIQFEFEFSKEQVLSISCGRNHSIMLTSDGIFTWGQNDYGQLGLGDNLDRNSPEKMKIEAKEVVSISSGNHHSMILTSNGILSWGRNDDGQLGLGHNRDRNIPRKIDLESNEVRSMICGGYHSMILTCDGLLFSWGNNSNGQLGLGHSANQNKPTLVQFEFGEILSIGCGWDYSIVLTKDGIFSWGRNSNGELGLEHNNDENKPQRMKWNNIDIFTTIHCCAGHSIITSSEGMFSWGWNEYGQLGNGNNLSSSTPELIVNGKDMKLKSQGSPLMWEFQRIIWFGKILYEEFYN